MNRVVAGVCVIIAAIAMFGFVASQRGASEEAIMFTGIAAIALGVGGLCLMFADDVAGDRTSNHHTEVHVHGQGQPAWMDRPQAPPPQPIFMMMPQPQYPPAAPGVSPEMMHEALAMMDRRMREHQYQLQAQNEAHHRAMIERAQHMQLSGPHGLYMGQLGQAPDGRYIDVEHRKALSAPRGPSMAAQAVGLLFKGKAR